MVKMSLEKKLKQYLMKKLAYNENEVVTREVLEELGLVAQKMMRRHADLIAELNDQAFNLAPPKSNVEMQVIDYDEVEESVNSFYNALVGLLVENSEEIKTE